jgi:hypothetical protein
MTVNVNDNCAAALKLVYLQVDATEVVSSPFLMMIIINNKFFRNLVLVFHRFHAAILLGLFDPENGGDMFLLNVG